MPEPATAGRRYVPALDGVRALAVIAVVAYHLGYGWAPGGLLGVGVFFTLSGYLITDILIAHYGATGRFGLATFWLHRARRLLPALLVMIAVVTAWVTLLHRSQLAPIRGAVVAALGYVSNWWLIGQHLSYFAQFGPPSPLGHLWSLAVEEQFYLVWPWLLVIGVRILDRHRNAAKPRRRLAVATLALAAASAVDMAVLYHPSLDMTRVYDGTDTRAFGLLIGAGLAMLFPSLQPPASRNELLKTDLAGTAGLLCILVMVWRINEYSAFLYRGGLVVLSLATAAIIAAVVRRGSWLGLALGTRPLRWVGQRSYGIYLWHFPVVVLTSPGGLATPQPLRATLEVAVTVTIAAASWRFVEAPVRSGAIGRWWRRRNPRQWRALLRGWQLVAVSLAFVVSVTACVGMSTSPPGTTSTASSGLAAATTSTTPTSSRPGATPKPTPSRTKPPAAPTKHASPASAATMTSCHSVVHIGDSTSEGMISPDYLPDPDQRLDAQYARVGVAVRRLEISGGTSVLETAVAGQPNARQVAQQLIDSGYHGCWVLALGTNDTADVYVGTALGRSGRIAQMMSVIGNQPVIWVTVKTLRTVGPYSNANMRLWNQALVQACGKYPNLRIYDWASVVQNAWFGSDRIHYTSAGYAVRAQLIANSLVHAFPAPAGSPPSPSCVVH